MKKAFIQAAFDVVALNLSIPVAKTLCCVREKLMHDESLADRPEWKVDDIMKLLTICLQTNRKINFRTFGGYFLWFGSKKSTFSMKRTYLNHA